MTIKVATAPDSWGVWYPKDEKQVGWERYLDEVQKAGYSYTELGPWGYLPTDPATLLSELGRRDIKLCGTGVVHPLSLADSAETLAARVGPICGLLKAAGAEWFVLMDESESYAAPGDRLLDDKAWAQMIAIVSTTAKRVVEEYGMKFVFHPHVGTCIETEAEIERLLADTRPDHVGLCFDLGHHIYTGADPLAFMARHADRIPYYHFKNMDGALRQRITDENIPFMDAFQMGVMCELDKGAIDFAEVVKFLEARNYDGFAVVEQDMYPCPPEKPYPIAKHNRDYLKTLGL